MLRFFNDRVRLTQVLAAIQEEDGGAVSEDGELTDQQKRLALLLYNTVINKHGMDGEVGNGSRFRRPFFAFLVSFCVL